MADETAPWKVAYQRPDAPKTEDDVAPWQANYQSAPPTQAAPAAPESSGLVRRVVGDTAVDLGKGVLGVGEAAVGLLDIPTMGHVGKGLASVGYDPQGAKDFLGEFYSPERQAANAEVEQAEGFLGTAGAMLRNPSTIVGAAVESAPLMLAGGAIGRAAKLASPVAAAALGEGAVGAGAAAEGMRQQSQDGTLNAKQVGAAIGSGVGTGLLGAAGGKIAQKLGIADIDTAIVGGASAAQPSGNLLKRAAQGVVSEGLLEEAPQSAQEQAFQNYGMDKPLLEGVGAATAAGALTGGLMGGGAAALVRPNVNPNAGPISRAASQGPAVPHPNAQPGTMAAAANDLTVKGVQGVTEVSLGEAIERAKAKKAGDKKPKPAGDQPVPMQMAPTQPAPGAIVADENKTFAIPPANMDPATGELLTQNGQPDTQIGQPEDPTAGRVDYLAGLGRNNGKVPGVSDIVRAFNVHPDKARELRKAALAKIDADFAATQSPPINATPEQGDGQADVADASPSPMASVGSLGDGVDAQGQPDAARAAEEDSAPVAEDDPRNRDDSRRPAREPTLADDAAQPQAEGVTFDESDELQDDDIGPASGGAFSIRGAADQEASRRPGSRVVELADGGFVVREPRQGPQTDQSSVVQAPAAQEPAPDTSSIQTEAAASPSSPQAALPSEMAPSVPSESAEGKTLPPSEVSAQAAPRTATQTSSLSDQASSVTPEGAQTEAAPLSPQGQAGDTAPRPQATAQPQPVSPVPAQGEAQTAPVSESAPASAGEAAPSTGQGGVNEAQVRADFAEVMRAKHPDTKDFDYTKSAFADEIVKALNREPAAIEWMRENGANGLNAATLNVFAKHAGIKMPRTQKGQKDAIDAWAGIAPETRAASDAKREQSAQDKRNADVAARRAEREIPDFDTAEAAHAWMKAREKAFDSAGQYHATPEYAKFRDKVMPLFDKAKAAYVEKKSGDLKAAGLKAGDSVQTSQVGAFMTGHTWSGKIFLKAGVPWVRLDGNDTIPVSRNGKVSMNRAVHWDDRWRKPEESAQPATPTQAEPAKAANGATHADPGEQPEAATPAVIAEAAQKAARAPTVTMAEARKSLLAQIDDAIKTAPENIERGSADNPHTTSAKMELRRKTWEVSIDRTLDNGLKTPTLKIRASASGNSFDILHSGKALASTESLLAARLTAGRLLQGADWKAGGAAGSWSFRAVETSGMVTLNVPGDGTFKVRNTKERLQQFRKQVEAQFKNRPDSSIRDLPDYQPSASLTASAASRAKIMAEAETVDEEVSTPTAGDKADPQPQAEGAGQPTKEKGKAETPQAIVKAQHELFTRLRKGEASLADYKAGFETLRDNREAVKAHLATLKKSDLLDLAGARYRNDPKPRVVDAALDSLVSNYQIGRGISFSMGAGQYEKAVQAQIDGTTDADLAAYAERFAEARKEREKALAGMENPETLEDFIRLARSNEKGEEGLSPEHRARLDALRTEARREDREAQAKRNAEIRRVDTGATGMQLVETQHTQKGHDLFVVKTEERVDREVYNALNIAAKRLGGHYSSYRGNGAIPGFTFTTREAAEQFMAVREGNVDASAQQEARAEKKAEARAETLAEKAATLKERAQEKLNRDRNTNTARRAAHAASAEADARRELAIAETMAKLGKAIESGDAKLLQFVRHKTQIELFDSLLHRAHDDHMRALGVNWEKAKEQPITAESITNAKLPQFTISRGELAVVAKRVIEKRGGKAFGEALAKMVDYGDEYGKAVQQSPFRFVLGVQRNDGSDARSAVFATKREADAVLARSPERAKGVVVKLPDGFIGDRTKKWAVAMSPELAIERKLWAPDYDKKVTLNQQAAEKIVDLLGSGYGTAVPYWFESRLDQRKQFAKLGIETNYEFREALREYLALREAPAEEDRIRKLERALVGNKSVGVDFFPTPPAVIQRLLEQADVGPDMRVLEPSAGKGDIAEALRDAAEGVQVDTVEMSGTLRELLEAKGFAPESGDFLEHQSEPVYDRIVMNPPFGNDNGASHVRHAFTMLKPGGRLVAVMGAGPRGKAEFDTWLESVGGLSEPLPEGSFKSSFRPTGVATQVVVIDKDTNSPDERTRKGDEVSAAATFSRTARATLTPSGIPKGLPLHASASVLKLERALRPFARSGGEAPRFRAVKPDSLPDALSAAFAALERFSGTRIEVLRNLNPDASGLTFDGVTLRDGVLFVDETATHPATTVASHEFTHQLMADRPDLYSVLEAEVRRQGRLPEWVKELESRGETRAEAVGVHELVADAVGDALTDRKFLERMAQRNPSKFRQLADAFLRFLDGLLGSIRDLGSNDYLTDVQAFRSILADVLDQYANEGPANAANTESDALFQRVFHGSPARNIERFDSEFMGTGEGAQAFGWGHYFASRRELADFYRDKLSGTQITPDILAEYFTPGRRVKGYGGTDEVVRFEPGPEGQEWNWRVVVREVRRDGTLDYERSHHTTPDVKEVERVLDRKLPRGQVYQVEVPENDELLDWDKPLAEQPQKVREALQAAGVVNFDANTLGEGLGPVPMFANVSAFTGEKLYRRLIEREFDKHRETTSAARKSSERAASEYLNSIGIPGLRYLDGSSRAAGEGHHNYVIWNEDAIGTPEGTLFHRAALADDDFDLIENNGSGDSSASIEAINRRLENIANGQVRVLIERDGSVRALLGVDAVDTHARSGQIIVQRGIGKEAWTVLSQGNDVSRELAQGRLNAAMSKIDDLLAEDEPLFHRRQTETPAFRKWFGGSKIVDEAGQPLVLYHGTTKQFDEFDPESGEGFGIFLTPDRAYASQFASGDKGRVVEVYAAIQNPVDIPYSKYDAESLDRALMRGDGAIVRDDETGEIQIVVATNPNQVKSATNNSGEFDPSNPNILFHRRMPADALDDIEAVMNAGGDRTLLQQAKDKLADLTPAKVKDALRGTWLGALTTSHLTELGSDYFENIKHYSDFLGEMNADRNQLQQEGEEMAEPWRQWAAKHPAEQKELAGVMHDATIDGVDPSKEYAPLQFRYAGKLWDATPKNVKDAIKAITQQMRERAGDSKRNMLDEIKSLRAMRNAETRRVKTYPAMVQRYNALSDEAKGYFAQVRDAYLARSKMVEDGLVARIEDTDAPEHQKRKLITTIRQQFETHRLQGVYFPLQRHGQYFVAAEKDDTHSFLMTDSLSDLERKVKGLKDRGWTIKAQGLKSQGKAAEAPSGTFVADVIAQLQKAGVSDATQDSIYQMYLEALPELSMRKHAIHRKNVPGFDPDAIRAFAFNMHHGAHQIARLRYAHKLTDTIAVLREQQEKARKEPDADTRKIAAGDAILGELDKRHQWISNPTDSNATAAVSSFGFIYYLGLTPAASLVNLTQTALVSFPHLAARYGPIKAFNALLAGMADSATTLGHAQKKLTDPDEIAAHAELQRMGALDKTQAHNLAGIAEGGMSGYNPAWAKAMKIIGWGFHKTEVINREATGLATYRLARQTGETHEQAIKSAARAINDTHFDYTNQNRARFMQSGTAKVLLMFRQYSLNMTWHLGRMLWQATKGQDAETRKIARRNLAGVLGMSALFSGTLGLPLMSVTFGVLNAIAASAGDDDEPWDAETEFRAFLNDMLGESVGEVLANGPVNKLTGADIASRVSLSQLWFRDADRELDGRGAYYNLLEQAAGPMGGVLKNALVGKQLMDDGHVMRGVETMLPKALKDAVKAQRYATEGVNNLRGDPLVPDVSLRQLLLQLAGFTPDQIAKQYDDNRALKNYEQAIKDRRQHLMDALTIAIQARDTEGRNEVMEKVRAFNRKYPEVAISQKSIRRSLAQRARYSRDAENGIVLDRRLARRVREEVAN